MRRWFYMRRLAILSLERWQDCASNSLRVQGQ
jgi:hypothetical protein